MGACCSGWSRGEVDVTWWSGWARRVVDGPVVLWMGLWCSGWARRLLDGPIM